MNDFVSIEILGTMTGCSLIITLLTQVFKKYLPQSVDSKWLALAFSIIVGALRIVYVQQFDFAGIVAGIFNMFVLLASAIGIYEITSDAKTLISGGNDNEIKK